MMKFVSGFEVLHSTREEKGSWGLELIRSRPVLLGTVLCSRELGGLWVLCWLVEDWYGSRALPPAPTSGLSAMILLYLIAFYFQTGVVLFSKPSLSYPSKYSKSSFIARMPSWIRGELGSHRAGFGHLSPASYYVSPPLLFSNPVLPSYFAHILVSILNYTYFWFLWDIIILYFSLLIFPFWFLGFICPYLLYHCDYIMKLECAGSWSM